MAITEGVQVRASIANARSRFKVGSGARDHCPLFLLVLPQEQFSLGRPLYINRFTGWQPKNIESAVHFWHQM